MVIWVIPDMPPRSPNNTVESIPNHHVPCHPSAGVSVVWAIGAKECSASARQIGPKASATRRGSGSPHGPMTDGGFNSDLLSSDSDQVLGVGSPLVAGAGAWRATLDQLRRMA
jgi:hypothetical protein